MKKKFVLINSFPRMSTNAEVELAKRFEISCQRMGFEFISVRNSREILDLDCASVVAIHEVSPKLTPAKVVGLMWNPPFGIKDIKNKVENLNSFDAYIPASEPIRCYLKSLNNQIIAAKPIANFDVFPSSPTNIASSGSFSSLMYLGVHWDGFRHRDLLESLARMGEVSLYGPPDKWELYGAAYRGLIPFDGVSVIKTLAAHGIALCLHRDEHIQADVPSMRLFEAASAGCVIICDSLPFARRVFGESIFVIPDGDGKTDFVREKLSFIRANPVKARQMAAHSKHIFDSSLSLDRLLPKIHGFSKHILKDGHKNKSRILRSFAIGVEIDVIYSHVSSNIEFALEVLKRQTFRSVRLIILHKADADVKVMRNQARHYGIRAVFTEISTYGVFDLHDKLNMTLRAGLVTWLNHDTEWSRDHLQGLFSALRLGKHADAASSECVAVREDGKYIDSPNFFGELEAEVLENRALIRLGGSQDQKWSYFADRFGLPGVSNWLAKRDVFLGCMLSIARKSPNCPSSISEYLRMHAKLLLTRRVTVFVGKYSPEYLDDVRFW